MVLSTLVHNVRAWLLRLAPRTHTLIVVQVLTCHAPLVPQLQHAPLVRRPFPLLLPSPLHRAFFVTC
jgi:hypothetical protein